MKTIFTILTSLIFYAGAFSQVTFNSVKSGKWSDPASWDQHKLPSENDVIVIHNGHKIVLDKDIKLSNITLRVLGVLELAVKKKMELNASSIINILTGGQLISQDKTAHTIISLGNATKYRGNKIYAQGWEKGTVKGMAYATGSSGNVDQQGQGFILGKLPAVWQDFSLVRTPDNHIQMVWVTSHETGTRIFEIERSYNSSNWTKIGTIVSAGNLSSQNIYSYVDNKPGTGMVFYRVKHVYPDGKHIFSAVRLMKISAANTGFALYPNPATSRVVISFDKVTKEESFISIYNTNGQTIKTIKAPKDIQFFPVDLTGISSGMYMLQVSSPVGGKKIMHLVKH